GNLAGLAVAHAHPAVLVSDDDDCGEREVPTTLDHFGHAVDVDDSVDEFAQALEIDRHLELQPALTGALGQRAHATVVGISVAIEHHFGDALLRAGFGQRHSHQLGLVTLLLALDLSHQRLRQGRYAGERLVVEVVDHLRVDVFVAAENGEAGALLGALDLLADTPP